MRGPEGPVRGGVTRCGRPPPRLRGRGNTSRLSTLSKQDCLRWTIVSACRFSCAMLASTTASTLSSSDRSGRGRTKSLPIARFARRGTVRTTLATRRRRRRRETEASAEADRRRLVTRAGPTGRKSVWRRWSCSSDCCADIGAPAVRRRSPAAKSTARERSGPGTGRCAASRTDRPRPWRLITACRTPRRRLDRCDTCRRSRRHHGAAPSSPTPCHPPAPRSRRSRTRASHGRNALTSRG